MLTRHDFRKVDLSRREAIQLGAGGLLGAAAILAGSGEAGKLAAQDLQPTPPPTDPHYPMPPSWSKELRQLAPNVYAYTQGGGPNIPNFGVSNPGMIAGPDYMWAIDGTQGPIPAKAFIAACKQATGKDFGRLLLTHHHGDHTAGVQFFQNAEVWSHPYCRGEVLKTVSSTPKMWSPAPDSSELGGWNSFPHAKVADIVEPRKLVVPMLTFKDDMTVFVGDTEVRFMYAGPAHTWGDMMAYLPKQKILFAGDIGFFWVAPFAQNGYISKWIETCDKILGMDVDVIVPGHGPIGGKKELNEMADYFRTLTVEARKRYDAKMTPGAAAADIRLGRFDNWIGTQLIITDTARLYDEWNGSLTPDVNTGAIREATQEYNQIKKAQGKAAEMIPLERMENHLAHAC
jgi:cyclase